MVSDKDNVFVKRSQTGVYDSTITCKQCEDDYQVYDDYAADILLKNTCKRQDISDPKKTNVEGYLLHGVDYTKLKLFFLLTLWRCSISEREEVDKVNVGAHLQKLESLILNKDPGDINDFSVMLFEQKFPDGMAFKHEPCKGKIRTINYTIIPIGRFVAYIKVDSRIDPKHSNIILNPNAPVMVAYNEFDGSHLESLLQQAIKANKFRKN